MIKQLSLFLLIHTYGHTLLYVIIEIHMYRGLKSYMSYPDFFKLIILNILFIDMSSS